RYARPQSAHGIPDGSERMARELRLGRQRTSTAIKPTRDTSRVGTPDASVWRVVARATAVPRPNGYARILCGVRVRHRVGCISDRLDVGFAPLCLGFAESS